MKIHLQRELDDFRKQLFHLSSLVENVLEESIDAVLTGDRERAAAIRERDSEIDRLEVEVEEACLKILALHQPVAVDLRFLIAALKMNNDLERIGDLAVNIAKGERCMSDAGRHVVFGDRLREIGGQACRMLRRSLESLMYMQADGAREVLEADDEVDAGYRDLVEMVKNELTRSPDDVEALVCWMLLAKHIERVADLATNIAEDTIYTIEGEIVRHGG